MVDITEQDYRRRLYVQPEKIYTEQMGINRLDRLQTPEQKDYIRRITKQSELKKPYQEDDYQDMEYHLDLPPGIRIPIDSPIFDPPVIPEETLPEEETPPPPIVQSYSIMYPEDLDGSNWVTVHNASTGALLNSDIIRPSVYHDDWDGVFISRGFLAFDLVDVPTDITVTAVELIMWASLKSPVSPTISIQAGLQAFPIVLEDYDAFSGSYFATKLIDAVYYNTFDFNAGGLSYIQSGLGGIVKLCIREYDHDYLDNAADGEELYAYFEDPEEAVTARRPELIIYYDGGSYSIQKYQSS